MVPEGHPASSADHPPVDVPGAPPEADPPRLNCMFCGENQAFWDPCDCLIAVGREIRSKAGQQRKRPRKKKQKDVTPDKPQKEMF